LLRIGYGDIRDASGAAAPTPGLERPMCRPVIPADIQHWRRVMKVLIVSLLATGALFAAAPAATASSREVAPTVDTAAQQGDDLSARRRHWRRAHYHRIVVAPRRYRYAYSPVIYPRPYYAYPAYRPYYGSYAWGPGPFGGYRYGGPWSGFMMGLGYGW
jgi:hypothetical protein